MREALFIKRNAKKWQTYQHHPTIDPDEKADRFITLVDDLAYAKTFYPYSPVTSWINSLVAATYLSIYKNKQLPLKHIIAFWKIDLPLLFRKYHGVLLFTFLIFALTTAIGVYTAQNDKNFVQGILGDDYVAMTETNIANGDPFGVYKTGDSFTMFVQIAFNNVKVGTMMVVLGITFGIGTLWMLFSNAMMLGCFQQLFFAKGLGLQSILVIWVHGTLEMLSMVIECTAGFIIAKGMLFPGTYRRIDAFVQSAKDAVKILIALIPIVITAAFLESYITRLMSDHFDGNKKTLGMPVWGSVPILLLSLFFMLGYFVIYPIRLQKRMNRSTLPSSNLLVYIEK
jgi:uncharacterized membrane protein SpoIIM required for sporulation